MLKGIGTIKGALLHRHMQNVSELLEQFTVMELIWKELSPKTKVWMPNCSLLLVIFKRFTSYIVRFLIAV